MKPPSNPPRVARAVRRAIRAAANPICGRIGQHPRVHFPLGRRTRCNHTPSVLSPRMGGEATIQIIA
jgi:hypothetical protein